jgi:hypothetical protein
VTTVLQQEHAHAWCDARIKELTDENEAMRKRMTEAVEKADARIIRAESQVEARISEMTGYLRDQLREAAPLAKEYKRIAGSLAEDRKNLDAFFFWEKVIAFIAWLIVTGATCWYLERSYKSDVADQAKSQTWCTK